jgi:hypothetical protein
MSSDDEFVRHAAVEVQELDLEIQTILSTYESSPSRVITLEKSYADLADLSLDQDELFREALRAVEQGLFRAAHVLAWAGFTDWLHHLLADHHLKAVQEAVPKWRIKKAEDFRDYSEFQVIDVGKSAKAYADKTKRSLHGLLDRRNECAHPSDYFPDLNMALGYITDLLDRTKRMAPKP